MKLSFGFRVSGSNLSQGFGNLGFSVFLVFNLSARNLGQLVAARIAAVARGATLGFRVQGSGFRV